MITKYLIGRVVFGVWVLIFLIYFFVGAQGVLYGWRVMAENDLLQQQIVSLEKQHEQLTCDIALWHHEPFVKEAMARERLQLARPDDMVYYFS